MLRKLSKKTRHLIHLFLGLYKIVCSVPQSPRTSRDARSNSTFHQEAPENLERLLSNSSYSRQVKTFATISLRKATSDKRMEDFALAKIIFNFPNAFTFSFCQKLTIAHTQKMVLKIEGIFIFFGHCELHSYAVLLPPHFCSCTVECFPMFCFVVKTSSDKMI